MEPRRCPRRHRWLKGTWLPAIFPKTIGSFQLHRFPQPHRIIETFWSIHFHNCAPLSSIVLSCNFLIPTVIPILKLKPIVCKYIYIYIHHFIIYIYTYIYLYNLYIYIFIFILQFIKLYAILIASGLDLPRHPGRDLQRLRGDVGSSGRWRYAKSDPHRWALGHLGPSGAPDWAGKCGNSWGRLGKLWNGTIWNTLKYDRIYLMILVDFLLISPIDRMSVMNPQKMLTVT